MAKDLKRKWLGRTEIGRIKPIRKRWQLIHNTHFTDDDVIKAIIYLSKSISYLKKGTNILEKQLDPKQIDSCRNFYSGYSLYFYVLRYFMESIALELKKLFQQSF